jgi:hypothetical protein
MEIKSTKDAKEVWLDLVEVLNVDQCFKISKLIDFEKKEAQKELLIEVKTKYNILPEKDFYPYLVEKIRGL